MKADKSNKPIKKVRKLAKAVMRPRCVYPIFEAISGSGPAGVFLSQLLYWSDKGSLPDGWIYKSYDEWRSETHISERDLDNARRVWGSMGIIEEKMWGMPRRLVYRINTEALTEAIQAYSGKVIPTKYRFETPSAIVETPSAIEEPTSDAASTNVLAVSTNVLPVSTNVLLASTNVPALTENTTESTTGTTTENTETTVGGYAPHTPPSPLKIAARGAIEEFDTHWKAFWDAYPARGRKEMSLVRQLFMDCGPGVWPKLASASANYAKSDEVRHNYPVNAVKFMDGYWESYVDKPLVEGEEGDNARQRYSNGSIGRPGGTKDERTAAILEAAIQRRAREYIGGDNYQKSAAG